MTASPLETERDRLVLLAYRICGSWADAEDVVQSVATEWLRVTGGVSNPQGWLTTVTVRRALDALRRRRREAAYVGPWLPDPLVTTDVDPAREAERGVALSMAFLVLAEELTPPQRAVVVLRALGYEHGEIASVLAVSPAAARQHHVRAMRRLARHNGRDPLDDETLGLAGGRSDGPPRTDRALLSAFLRAARDGDVVTLRALLHDEVVAYQDGGGATRAARRLLVGPTNVARFVIGVAGLHDGDRTARPVVVGGAAGALVRLSGTIHVLTVQVRDGRIRRLFDVCNPLKHAHLGHLGHLGRCHTGVPAIDETGGRAVLPVPAGPGRDRTETPWHDSL